MSDRPVVLDVWEVGVDRCRLCERDAVAASAWVGGKEPRLGFLGPVELVLACAEHAEQLEISTEWGPATCMRGERRESGQMVPCGAMATHVLLLVMYEHGEPEPGFLAVCRRHATPTGEE